MPGRSCDGQKSVFQSISRHRNFRVTDLLRDTPSYRVARQRLKMKKKFEMNSDHQSISISKFCNISVIIILFCFKILWKRDFLDLFVYHLDFFCFLFFFLYAIFSRGHATTPCRVGRPVGQSHCWIAIGLCITAPAQLSATGLPCIRPCYLLMGFLKVWFILSVHLFKTFSYFLNQTSEFYETLPVLFIGQ